MPQVNITVEINDSIYLRDPLSSALGKKMLHHTIILLDEIGFEDFNFKKLAKSMESTEASVYRYFENKYRLLAYLVAWYWDYMHFMIILDTRNVSDPKERLKIIVKTLVMSLGNATTPDYIDQDKLHRIVVENATKVYHNKKVDQLQEKGFYNNYKKLVSTMSSIIKEVDESFKFPRALATNIIELSLNSEYYMTHFPTLTDYDGSTECKPCQDTIVMIDYMLDRMLG